MPVFPEESMKKQPTRVFNLFFFEDAFICLYGFGFPGVRPFLLAGQSREPYRPDMPVEKFPNALIFYRKQDLFEEMNREDLKFQRI